MSESWTWTYEDASGAVVADASLPHTSYPTQSDAESWLGDTWRELRAQGVSSVTLYVDGTPVYGPMGLTDGT
ncbi:hypothetical protein ATK17_0910 [Branchiibius hedensis]|uniref:YD repeat-containing protein n=1 Tax=Branchiibius hedensis TaxID=672460 RepID=A0A2Y8ZNW9_9MICO|nr:hypothetical protein [Branchiibius hedensis]PWJ24809.1 hypothetical protein ATK17_0910 [Branchiibius hedensis]SSA33625.1 hypothetical protein SAMN04489750_0910 [Branchiibius hedensis]